MYVKIRKISAVPGDSDLIITISKMATIDVLREQIRLKWGCEPNSQRLFYKGKQLNDEYRIMDYDIQLNDVIQLMVQLKEEKTVSETDNSLNKKVLDENELIDVQSTFYKLGDLVDIQDEQYGAWFEYVITAIKAKRKDAILGEEIDEQKIQFFATWEIEREQTPLQASFNDIRPRARHTYDFSDLTIGQAVMVNYNIEEPSARGYWYDMTIDKIVTKGTKFVIGTLQVGKGKVPLQNCKIKFVNEIMKVEKPMLLTDKTEDNNVPIRKSQYYCSKCKDNKSKKCKECGCGICGGKNNPSTIILCDECDTGYHLACLNPPLSKIPEEAEWYCPECKNDENEIVKAGDKLKVSNKKAKMASSNKESGGRDWGRGMACVGRTKECTIVPKDHYGPIPGVDVGTCWKFRLQASEAGIHRPHVAGIHGRETDGAYSLVLSGGYEDDVDNGVEFWYTGSGGRDLSGNKRVSEQSCDQTLTRMNKALALNCNAKFNNKDGAEAKDWKGGKPVRVVRNYKLAKHSKYAPKDGNRYDGLYKVVKYYPQKGKSGFIVWRFVLRRDDPNAAPWEKGGQELEMVYPPGYLEAQQDVNPSTSAENQSQKKRKKILGDKNENETPTKKQKIEKYKLSKKINDLIKSDTANEKLWSECNEALRLGKQDYVAKVQSTFICICCQEVVYKPITTECKHNICLACLQRSFNSEIYTCPYCRFDLGADYKMNINKNLSDVLLELLPGYEMGR